jgi:hypothetical protein
MAAPRSNPPPSIQDDDELADQRGSRVMRFGAAVSAVLVASIFATMPAAMRIALTLQGTCGAATVWLALLALAFVPLAVATVTLRHAIAALRLFDASALARGVATAILWGVATFVTLAGLGAFLRATTHHHGLAGATFAITGLVLAALLALIAVRFVDWCLARSPAIRWLAIGVVSLAMGVALAFFARHLGRSEVGNVFAADVVAFVFAAAFGAGAFPYRRRPFVAFAVAGPPLATIVLFVGLGALKTTPPLRAAIGDEAPVLATGMAVVGVAWGRGGPPH